jgi:hypothetical protein
VPCGPIGGVETRPKEKEKLVTGRRRKKDREQFRAVVAARRNDARRRAGPPTPARITLALDLAGLDGPQVDVACGGVEPMVDEWEAGTRVPTDAQIKALARLTGMTVDSFYLPAPDPMAGWVCQRSGPGKGCTHLDTRPDAPVVPIVKEALW